MYLFIASGMIYVIGAMGLEILGGIQDVLHGSNTLVYLLLCTIEEILEMLGIAIFIYTLLSYIREQFQSFSISVKND